MILQNNIKKTLWPLSETIGDIHIGAETISDILEKIFSGFPDDLLWDSGYFPDEKLLQCIADSRNFTVTAPDGKVIGKCGNGSAEKILFSGTAITYPWDILCIAEMITGKMSEDVIRGEISPLAVIDGRISLGENSTLLPGVFIEGNCIIGKNCKIGPNCYIRGNTIIGDNCRIGNAVEIKNCVFGNSCCVSHLSYAGDSVLASHINFGAGTIISNLRHDGRNHRSMVNGELIDTGRRKFGAVIGENVHTGINTSIYCGRKISADSCTDPGMIVKYDI